MLSDREGDPGLEISAENPGRSRLESLPKNPARG